jgi:hypothetical protein
VNFSKEVNVEKLDNEIKNSSLFGKYQGLVLTGNDLYINTTNFSQEEIDLLTNIINAHSSSLLISQYAKMKRIAAQEFGEKIYNDFIDENITLGITQLGLTSHIRKALFQVSDAVKSGSLYDAIIEIKSLDPVVFDSAILTSARLLIFRNKIEEFLNISPRSTFWNQ